jgi:hypothetical protein
MVGSLIVGSFRVGVARAVSKAAGGAAGLANQSTPITTRRQTVRMAKPARAKRAIHRTEVLDMVRLLGWCGCTKISLGNAGRNGKAPEK